MQENKPNILFITSANLNQGPGRIALDYYEAFKELEINADFLFLESQEGYPQFDYIFEKEKNSVSKTLYQIRKKLFYNRFLFNYDISHVFFYRYEECPPVPNRLLLKYIKKDYDLVLILFWQEMLSFSSIKAIYSRLHCQIQFLSVDYSAIAGGCHFLGNCDGYKKGCKECKAVKPSFINGFPSHNVLYRKKVYEMVKPIVWGNRYMQNFFSQSLLVKDERREVSLPFFDTEYFRPMPKKDAAENIGVDLNGNFVISFGCQSLADERKGMKYLLESLSIFKTLLSEQECKNILVLTIGNVTPEVDALIPFTSKHMGYVSYDKLCSFYNCSDAFMSTSINDAGPTMVNQAICCGVPVVSFEMGTALDCVKGQNTGYCVPLKDSKALAESLRKHFDLDENSRQVMKDNCREYAVSHYTRRAKIASILSAYEKYKS